jgi:hypothetical protein
MNALRLSEKDPAETVPVSWDFKEDIAEGMTLSNVERRLGDRG